MFRRQSPVYSGVIATVLGLVLAGQASVQAASPLDWFRMSREMPICQALDLLSESKAHQVVEEALESHKVYILFKDMNELGKGYVNHDALTLIGDDDAQIILINIKHQTAPPPALAALIRHELMHNDRDNSLSEEYTAWHQEAEVWREMLVKFPQLKTIMPKQFPLVDRMNAISILEQQNRLNTEIQSNIAYRSLPEHSPGF